jgi:hypothetical protein
MMRLVAMFWEQAERCSRLEASGNAGRASDPSEFSHPGVGLGAKKVCRNVPTWR